jgi:hypothetical protein
MRTDPPDVRQTLTSGSGPVPDSPDTRHETTDQKVGSSSPSERARSEAPYQMERAFLLLLGATLGATGIHQPPNSARLIDSVAARLSPSSRRPYTSFVMAMLA